MLAVQFKLLISQRLDYCVIFFIFIYILIYFKQKHFLFLSLTYYCHNFFKVAEQ